MPGASGSGWAARGLGVVLQTLVCSLSSCCRGPAVSTQEGLVCMLELQSHLLPTVPFVILFSSWLRLAVN